MSEQEIFKTGSQPSKGRYVCVECREDVFLDDDTDRLPPCAKCHKTDFTREAMEPELKESEHAQPKPEKKKEKKPKEQKDMIKVTAIQGGRFASNRDGAHIEVIINKGENIITKAQYEICKDAPTIKRL